MGQAQGREIHWSTGNHPRTGRNFRLQRQNGEGERNSSEASKSRAPTTNSWSKDSRRRKTSKQAQEERRKEAVLVVILVYLNNVLLLEGASKNNLQLKNIIMNWDVGHLIPHGFLV